MKLCSQALQGTKSAARAVGIPVLQGGGGCQTEPDDIVDELRSFELDHDQDGWPAVRMSQISSACDEIERLREWKNKAAEVMARFVSLSSHPEPMSWGETASDATKLLVDRGD